MLSKETKKTESVHKKQNCTNTNQAIKFKLVLLIILLLIFFILAAITFLLLSSKQNIKKVTIGNTTYELQVADTEQEREKGLSGQKSLSSNGGMILDFNKNGDWGIWMKDMNFNIDIAWIDQNGKVIGKQINIEPSTYPNSFSIATDSRYVIELPAGTLSKNNIQVGNFVKIN